MNSEQTKKFKKRLEDLQAEILRAINPQQNEESGEPRDEIDHANDLIEQDMESLMSTNMRSNLKDVEAALERINAGEFGKCQLCEKEISPKRLDMLPFAKYCTACQEKAEHKGR
jgi:DnaK suppressor protein